MRILHTEASIGWGGQEIRILREAEGMRKRGHEIIFAIVKEGQLAERARQAGFLVYEFPMGKKCAISNVRQLVKIIQKHNIDIVNTHSSFDSWVGSIAGRITRRKVLRTRHLSTRIRSGWNAQLLYRILVDAIVTTCEYTAQMIHQLSNIDPKKCISIPTGVDPDELEVSEKEKEEFRKKYGLKHSDCVAGTLCVFRDWKGLDEIVQAAKILHEVPNLKWLIVGDGEYGPHIRSESQRLGVEDKVIFTGYLKNPFVAIACMDIFLLLSTASEGVSQASLQAGCLGKPHITTKIGGLHEVCIDQQTGFNVDVKAPVEVAEKVKILVDDSQLRAKMGQNVRNLVLEKFTFNKTLDDMETVYKQMFV